MQIDFLKCKLNKETKSVEVFVVTSDTMIFKRFFLHQAQQ